MRTTLVIPDTIFKRFKSQARKDNQSLSHLVAEALELYILKKNQRRENPVKKTQLRTYSMGKPSVDINNREELYRRMETGIKT